jgi:hypothetical protein
VEHAETTESFAALLAEESVIRTRTVMDTDDVPARHVTRTFQIAVKPLVGAAVDGTRSTDAFGRPGTVWATFGKAAPVAERE